MNTKSAFLTFTPQLVSLFGYLWDNEREVGDDFRELVVDRFPELCENMATSVVYGFGTVIDGLYGHQLVVAMDILSQNKMKFSYLDDFCCLLSNECESSYGHPALRTSAISDEMAIEMFGKTFSQLQEDEDGEEKLQAVERKFDELYISFSSLTEKSCEITK